MPLFRIGSCQYGCWWPCQSSSVCPRIVVSSTAIRVGQHDALLQHTNDRCKASLRWVNCPLIGSTCISCGSLFWFTVDNPSFVSIAVAPLFQYQHIGIEKAMSVPDPLKISFLVLLMSLITGVFLTIVQNCASASLGQLRYFWWCHRWLLSRDDEYN